MLEIELKFRAHALSPIEGKLRANGAELLGTHDEADTYFNAPDRDFAKTGEAVRLRRTGTNGKLTYKGPKKPDAKVKTRTEVELPLVDGDTSAEIAEAFLQGLGYKPVAVVQKTRREYHMPRGKFGVTCCLDDVENLGTFVELEILCEEPFTTQAQDELLKLASELGLNEPLKHSYLRMQLTRQLGYDPAGDRP